MTINGNDIIIKANGQAIAASKTCTINLKAATHPVSSSSGGDWEHNMVGLKSWDFTLNQLLVNNELADATLDVVAEPQSGNAIVSIDGRRNESMTGWACYRYNIIRLHPGQIDYVLRSTLEAEGSDPSQVSEWIDAQTSYDSVIVVVGGMETTSLLPSIAHSLAEKGVDTTQYIDDLAMLDEMPGVIVVVITEQWSGVYYAADGGVSLQMGMNNGDPIAATPLKTMLSKVGTVFEIEMGVRGLALDRVSGMAICRTCQVVGTRGNLATGSFAFLGTGPLT